MQRLSLHASHAYCDRLARRAAGNFYHAFRLLPREQRRAMCALYAFLRIADDLGDGEASLPHKRELLAGWREALFAAMEGDYRHPLYPALHHTIRTHGLPVRHLVAVLDGVCMDLDITHYDTFEDLYRYCYYVASAVGLSCIHIWGFTGDGETPAEAAGLALQLTNILRDVGEDAGRGRIYLPTEDLIRFGCTQEQLRQGRCDDRFRELMHFQAARARAYYEQAMPLVDRLRPAGRAVFLVMLRTYRALLDAMAARQFDVFADRVSLGTWHKVWLAVQAIPVRYGLVAGGTGR